MGRFEGSMVPATQVHILCCYVWILLYLEDEYLELLLSPKSSFSGYVDQSTSGGR